VTVFDAGVLDDLGRDLGLAEVPDPLLARRNIVLRCHGGVRCVPLDDGELRVGPATLTAIERAGSTR
jgi:hypothetical protein